MGVGLCVRTRILVLHCRGPAPRPILCVRPPRNAPGSDRGRLGLVAFPPARPRRLGVPAFPVCVTYDVDAAGRPSSPSRMATLPASSASPAIAIASSAPGRRSRVVFIGDGASDRTPPAQRIVFAKHEPCRSLEAAAVPPLDGFSEIDTWLEDTIEAWRPMRRAAGVCAPMVAARRSGRRTFDRRRCRGHRRAAP